MMIVDLRKDLNKLANPKKAKLLAGFFKTGTGEYGEGDIFLGVMVPQSRSIAKKYQDLPEDEIKQLLQSKIHEERLIALFILINNFQKGEQKKQKEIYELYLKSTKYINNWDLIDLSTPRIVGMYLLNKEKDILIKLAKSKSLWEKRIAIMSTMTFIKFKKEYDLTFKIAEILLQDSHDLIHKAVGWMLREVGKNISQEIEESFLRKYYKTMPRTMLRYAIEKFPENLRKKYLKGD